MGAILTAATAAKRALESHENQLKRIFPVINPTHPGYCPYTAVWYVDSANGSDQRQGDNPARPFKSLTRAVAAATAMAKAHQCIVLEPSTTAYNASETFTAGIAIPATLTDLTIMSRSAITGRARHTVVGATNAGSTSGLLYCWASRPTLINLCFLSNKLPVYVGTETTHGQTTNTVVVGAHLKGCVFDTGTTTSQPALSLSCTDAYVEDCEAVAGGTTADGIVMYDPARIENCDTYTTQNSIYVKGGAGKFVFNNVRIHPKAAGASVTQPIFLEAGSADVSVINCRVAPDVDGDATASVVAKTGYTGKVEVIQSFGLAAVATPSGGAGDKAVVTTAIAVVKAIS